MSVRISWVFWIGLGCVSPVVAHDPGMSALTVDAEGERLKVTAAFAPTDLAMLAPLDADGDGRVADAEFEKASARVLEWAPPLLEVRLQGHRLHAGRVQAALKGNNLSLVFEYPVTARSLLTICSRALEGLPRGHRQYLAFRGASGLLAAECLLDSRNNTFEIDLKRVGSDEHSASMARFAVLGVEHILTGYDHLLFLLGLLIVCARLADSAGIITAFTLAHSLTLALAAVQRVSLPPSLVEPLIAVSVVAVGLENLWGGRLRRRWMMAFAFGLVHGLGFASALRGLLGGISGQSLILPVFSFNLGVELGQLAVAAAFIPLLQLLRRQPFLEGRLAPVCSLAVIAAGGVWLLERTLQWAG